jgi:predicted DCC family thiol-disulfide oxidoreductase YuxK
LTAKLGTFPRFAGFACESEPSIAIGASLGESIRHAETISIQLTDNAWEDSEAIIKLIEMVRQHGQACRIRFDRAFTPAPFANSFWPEQPSIGDNRDN